MELPVIAAIILTVSAAASFAQTPALGTNPLPPVMARPSTPSLTAPAVGSNSFTMSQAQSRIEAAGYIGVTGLAKDKDGVWRGMATKGGASKHVSLDYQGNVVAN